MEKLKHCKVYEVSLCFINQNEANVRTLQVTGALGMLVPSKLDNGLQTPQDMDMKRMIERCRSLCLWI